MQAFDGRAATEAPVMERALSMPGRSFRQLVSRLVWPTRAARTPRAASVSQPRPSSACRRMVFSEPDFRSAGIELKTVPLRPRDDKILVKERVFISMLDYHALGTEESATASVRRKLSRILFIYYDWLPSAPLGDLFVSDVALWAPSPELLESSGQTGMQSVDLFVRAGPTRSVSHTARPWSRHQGTWGPPSRTQPYSSALARQRAWALKPALVRGVLEEHRSERLSRSRLRRPSRLVGEAGWNTQGRFRHAAALLK